MISSTSILSKFGFETLKQKVAFVVLWLLVFISSSTTTESIAGLISKLFVVTVAALLISHFVIGLMNRYRTRRSSAPGSQSEPADL